MSDDQLRQMAAASGMDVTPEMLRASQSSLGSIDSAQLEALANMDPARAQAMAKMAAAMPPEVMEKMKAAAAGAGGVGKGVHDAHIMAQTAKAMAENPGGLRLPLQCCSNN